MLEYLVETGLGAPGGPAEAGAAVYLEQGAQRAADRLAAEAGMSPETRKRAKRDREEHVVRATLDEGSMGLHMRGALGPVHQMVPLRLSEPQHRLLKEWCAEHKFPMAVVIRGLVERFLEDQERRGGPSPSSAADED